MNMRIPFAGAARMAEEEADAEQQEDDDAPPEFHDIVKDSGMQVVSSRDLANEFGAEREGWKIAMAAELASMEEKGTFHELSSAESCAVPASKIMPMMLVPGIKPPDEAGYRRKKVRGVACGNFQKKDPTEE
eukprot:6968367-Pyramimonas_sp.AAC.1